MASDIRLCFIGDSLVAGVGDPEHLGWAGRLAARSEAKGLPLTTYNLGVRGDTSADVAGRWPSEIGARVFDRCDNRVVLSFGVNDVVTGVPADTSVAHLGHILDGLADGGFSALMVGPTAVEDDGANAAIGSLSARFAAVCLHHGVPYLETIHELAGDPGWMAEVRDGDGAHPGAESYARMADLVFDRYWEWLHVPPQVPQPFGQRDL